MALLQLGLGSRGNQVLKVQQALNGGGYTLDEDGIFGAKTQAAVKDFQKTNGLLVDGIVGTETGEALLGNSNGGTTGESNTNTSKSTAIAAPTVKPMPTTPTYDTSSYVEGNKVTSLGDTLNTHLANKPGEYQSQWQGKLDELMSSIMNRDKFSYDLNGDALYQQYKDKYIQQAKMAMGDAIGQASAMTGGYGNSYAQSVGQQAYQGQLDNLNDIVPELYQMALDKYNMEGQDLYNQYGMVSDRENLDYGRYRDQVADYLTERDYLTGRYDSERNFDYGKFINEQSNKNNVASQQFNDAMSIWGAETEQLWNQAQWDEAARQYANEESWRQKEWDREEQWRNEDIARAGSGGSGGIGGNGGGNGGVSLENIPGINTKDASYFDDNGNFKKAEFLGSTQDGRSSFRIGGKTVVLDKGVNPYTQTYNKDCQHGTFSNGYQPNNINNQKLSKSGIQDYMNGVLQTVWKTPDGNLWIWDGTQNKYEEYHE